MPAPRVPDAQQLGDFFVSGTAALGDLADIYGLQVAAEHAGLPLADFMAEQLGRTARNGDIVSLGPIALLAHAIENGRVTTVGLRLPEPEEIGWKEQFAALRGRLRKLLR
jgi:potassium/hydrogen antiporter